MNTILQIEKKRKYQGIHLVLERNAALSENSDSLPNVSAASLGPLNGGSKIGTWGLHKEASVSGFSAYL